MSGIIIASLTPTIPGSQPAQCWQCGDGCFLAPSGRELSKRFGLSVLCPRCGEAYLTSHPEMEIMSITPMQQEELVKAKLPRN
jgi:ribosomal protein S27AE